MIEQRIEAERAGVVALQVEGQGFRHILLIAEHGEDMLLAVAEVASIGRETYAQQGIAVVHIEGEADGGVAAGFRFKLFAAGQVRMTFSVVGSNNCNVTRPFIVPSVRLLTVAAT